MELHYLEASFFVSGEEAGQFCGDERLPCSGWALEQEWPATRGEGNKVAGAVNGPEGPCG